MKREGKNEQYYCVYYDICTFNFFRFVISYSAVSMLLYLLYLVKCRSVQKFHEKVTDIFFFNIKTTDAEYSDFNRYYNWTKLIK